MSRDRSLDEFLGGPNGTSDDGGAEDGGAVPDAGGVADRDAAESDGPDDDADTASGEPAEPVDPAEPTRAWSPDGAACAACGESAAVRWRQDGAYVCPDCKEW